MPATDRRSRHRATWMVAACAAACAAAPDLPAALPAAPVLPVLTVERHDGRTYAGRPGATSADRLVLRQEEGAGTIELEFTPADVRRLYWNDNDALQRARAAETAGDPTAGRLWAELWISRRRVLPWTDAAAWEIGSHHLRHLAREGRHAEVLAAARHVAAIAPDRSAQRALADAELTAAHALGLRDESLRLAREWIRTEPHPLRSALGHRIHAELSLAAGHPRDALEVAILGGAKSLFPPAPHAAECWGLAAQAMEALGRRQQADALRDEARRITAAADTTGTPDHTGVAGTSTAASNAASTLPPLP